MMQTKNELQSKFSEKMYQAFKALSNDEPFYFYSLLYVTFIKDEDFTHQGQPVIGVHFKNNKAVCTYNPKFTEDKSIDDLKFILIHEMDHLLLKHHKRTGSKNHELSNIAQDIVINETIGSMQKYKIPAFGLDLAVINKPKMSDQDRIRILTLPEEQQLEESSKYGFGIKKQYQGRLIYEELYDFLIDEMPEDMKQKMNGSGEDEDEGVPSNFDKHLEDINTSDAKKEMFAKEVLSAMKNAGHTSGSLEEKFNLLFKKRKNYLTLIKKTLQSSLGQYKQKSWLKINRKGLPLKGNKKVSKTVTIIIDTSGSMSHKDFEIVFSYMFQNGFTFNLIQADTEVHDHFMVKNKKEFKNIKLSGRGGTDFTQAFDYVKQKGLDKGATVLLTDGYAPSVDYSEFRNRGNNLIFSSGIELEYSGKIKKQIVTRDNDE